MKFPWLAVGVLIAVAVLSIGHGKSEEPAKASPPAAADAMRGKAPGDVRDNNALKMKFVWCPPGFLTMEHVEYVFDPPPEKVAEPNDDNAESKEKPAAVQQKPTPMRRPKRTITPVKVFVSQGFWLGKYEVTQADWKAVMKTEPWKRRQFTKDGADFPATFVNWNDASEFCRRLTTQEHQAGRLPDAWEYTLPTEAQWEHACRSASRSSDVANIKFSRLGFRVALSPPR